MPDMPCPEWSDIMVGTFQPLSHPVMVSISGAWAPLILVASAADVRRQVRLGQDDVAHLHRLGVVRHHHLGEHDVCLVMVGVGVGHHAGHRAGAVVVGVHAATGGSGLGGASGKAERDRECTGEGEMN
jgi:hypothetical protein